ncbi:MAG: thioredoxin family protein [Gemmatimonadota bacterium]
MRDEVTHVETGLEAAWRRSSSWDDYAKNEILKNPDLWSGVYRTTRIPEWATRRLAAIGDDWHLLVLAEDWCGDASNTVPLMARLAEASPGLQLGILKRDENADLMDHYLTDGSRSIPIAIVLDGDFHPVARWGPRPAELQNFVLSEKRAGLRPKADIYRDARRWYARDNGETTLDELIGAIENAAESRP